MLHQSDRQEELQHAVSDDTLAQGGDLNDASAYFHPTSVQTEQEANSIQEPCNDNEGNIPREMRSQVQFSQDGQQMSQYSHQASPEHFFDGQHTQNYDGDPPQYPHYETKPQLHDESSTNATHNTNITQNTNVPQESSKDFFGNQLAESFDDSPNALVDDPNMFYDQESSSNSQTSQPDTVVPNNYVTPDPLKQIQPVTENINRTNSTEYSENEYHRQNNNHYQDEEMCSKEQHYISDLGNQNYFSSDEHFDGSKKPSRASSSDSQATATSTGTSSSSYGFIPSVKSSDSESRLSPYQFIEGARYPCQSSENSNNSSPLEIVEGISTASASYENVLMPSNLSLSMSSFDITESVGNTSQSPASLSKTDDASPMLSNLQIQDAHSCPEPSTSTLSDEHQDANVVPNQQNNNALFDLQKSDAIFYKQKQLEKTAAELFQKAKEVGRFLCDVS